VEFFVKFPRVSEIFGIKKALARITAKPEQEMAVRNRMLVEGVEIYNP